MFDEIQFCPYCGSDKVAGLVAAFWVGVNQSASDVCWQTESEVTEKRRCGDCESEWEDGEEIKPKQLKPKKRKKGGAS